MPSEVERERLQEASAGQLGVGVRGISQQLLEPVPRGRRKERRQNVKINSFVELDV